MKRILLSIIGTIFVTCNIQAVQLSDSPGTPVWTLAKQDNLIVTTIESQVDALGQDINIDFDGTFTALDALLAKMCTVQSQAEQLALNVSTLEVNFGNDASKMCTIDSKVDALLIDVQTIDAQSTFTTLEALQTTLCSKVELLNAELAQVETDITNITQTEIDHDQTILSKLSVIDTTVTTINSILDNITFDTSLTNIDSLLDVIDTCLATVDSKLAPLESTVETNFAGTFTALEANLQKACTIESLADAIPMSFVADLTGVYTALNELEQTMCTIDSKVDNLDMSILSIESDVDILNSNIDQTLSKLCVLESKTDAASCNQCFSLMENIGTNLSNDCSILEELNDNQLLEKACSIDSNVDIIIDKLSTQSSKLDVIASETDIVESKICAIEMNNIALSKLNIIDSKIDVAQETTLTIASLVDVIDQTSSTIESKICNLSDDNILSKLDIIIPETQTICSNVDELIYTLSTIESKIDVLLSTNAGQLCADFGNTGTVTTGFAPLSTDDANAVAIQDDGKIIVAGQTNAALDFDFALARYLANGSLDVSFGVGGLVTTNIGGLSIDNAHGVAIQTNGKIVVAGQTTSAGTTSIALVRYNIDGSLDTTFNGTGIVITPPIGANTVALANAIRIQADGKIVIAGGTGLAASTDFLLARYNIDGSLDATFGVAGIATIDLGGIDVAHALSIQADGRLVVTGVSGTSIALARLTTAGILDVTFGGGLGSVITSIGSLAVANAVLLQLDGKIIVVGYSDLLGSNNFALARYNIDGSLDTSFGILGTGIVVQSFLGTSITIAHAATLQADGKIVVIGQNDISGIISFSLARFNNNGTIDVSFGINGQVTTEFSAGVSTDIAHAAAQTPNDQLIVVGQSNAPGSNDFALACYELDTSSIFLIEQKANAICTQLELLPTATLNSKLDNIEPLVCTIESNVDIVDSLVDNANMKAIDLETDFASTWTILDVIENKLCTSESSLEIISSSLENPEATADFSGIYTAIEPTTQKACTVDSKVDVALSVVDAAGGDDFTGVFTALDALESKVCLIENQTDYANSGIKNIVSNLGTPITAADLNVAGGYEITTSGNYYLTEDITLTVNPTNHTIRINASNVALDFCGHTIDQQSASGNFDVIEIQTGFSTTSNILIKNGRINNALDSAIVHNNGALTGLTIDNMSIENPGRSGGLEAGIYLSPGFGIKSNILISNCSITNSGDRGIFIDSDTTSELVINNCYITNCTDEGIRIERISNALITECTIENCSSGILLNSFDISTNTLIQDCIFSNNNIGVNLDSGPNSGVIRSNFFDNNTGISLGGNEIFAIDNTLTNNTVGIDKPSGVPREVIIMNNRIIGGTHGIRFSSGPDNAVLFNDCVENSSFNIQQTGSGGNTYLGNFTFTTGTNFSVGVGTSLAGKVATFSQSGAFPATEPTEWMNIAMTP